MWSVVWREACGVVTLCEGNRGIKGACLCIFVRIGGAWEIVRRG